MTASELKEQLLEANNEISKGNFDLANRLATKVLAELEKQSGTVEVGEAKKNISTAEGVSQSEELLRLQCEAILTLTQTNYRQGHYEKALEQANQAFYIANDSNLNDIKPKAWNLIGMVFRYLGSYDKALEYYQLALAGNQELGDKLEIARVTGNIGALYNSLGSYDMALEYCNMAVASHLELGNKSGAAISNANVGSVYYSLGSYDKALEYYHLALASHLELGQKSSVASVTQNIGNVYVLIGSYDKALEYHHIALASHLELGEKSSVASVNGNIGSAYSSLGSYDKALEYHQIALASHQEIGDKAGVARDTANVGSVYATIEFDGYDPKKAEEYLLKTVALSTEIGAKSILDGHYKQLADLYEHEKRWEDAFVYYKKYTELKDEINKEETIKQDSIRENRRKVEEAERDRQVKLARFQEQEKILHNILPQKIADRILDGEKLIADRLENVSVFFSDIVGFTTISQSISPEELVKMLNEIFTEFDRIAQKNGLEKIKTIGDAYMAVAGAPLPQENHAERAALFAIEAMQAMHKYRERTGNNLEIRVGLHSGHAVAGIIGENKFAYDLWGDAVNTASRMESHGEAGKIQVSEDFVQALYGTPFQFVARGEMKVKGKGMMKTYFMQQA